ncbi:MAG TPA: ABC transporter ATP-binding protein [Roseiflexaceae bacterium]|nr:ABC transporter ATP-binding protein [Roseiflexaceae bacterium]
MTPSTGYYRSILGTYLGPQRGRVALLGGLLLASIALQLISPQVIRSFIDATQSGAPAAALLGVAALFIGLAAAQRLLGLGALYVGEGIGWRATNALRADLTRHLLRLDMGFHKRRTPGELIERVDGDVGILGNFFSQFSLRLAGNALLVVGVLAALFREDWRVGLGLSAYALLVFGALAALQRLASGRWAQAHQAHAEQFGFLEERIGGAEDIRSSGAEAYTLRRLAALGKARMRSELAALMASNLTFVITNFLFVMGYALGLALGAWLYTRGEATIGTAFLIVYYIGMLAEPLEGIRAQVEDLQRAGAGLGRVSELLALQPRVRDAERTTPLPAGALGVAFDGVAFAYDDGGPGTADRTEAEEAPDLSGGAGAAAIPTPGSRSSVPGPSVLTDISFTLAPGRVLGLLGRTGSGKTTLTRLIFRLYDPARGAVRLGGVDLRDVALDDLRARVGMVTQEVQVFQASVRDNLALFNRRIDDGRILRALEELGLRAWVEALPEGLDTRLGAGGRGLSAGEAQLLAFTRLFLRDPGLVILDEASSRLDPATERLLERAVGRLLAGRTGIIIAHRLRTVQRADEIMVLERGRVIEHGERARLAADPASRFAQLLAAGMEEVLA